jgi:hypothetical protein
MTKAKHIGGAVALLAALWSNLGGSGGAGQAAVVAGGQAQQELANRAYRLTVSCVQGEVRTTLDDKLLGLRVAEGPYLYRAARAEATGQRAYQGLENASVKRRGQSLIVRGQLAGLELEHTLVLPRAKAVMEERILLRNPTAAPIALMDFEAGFPRRVADAQGQVEPELSQDRWVAVPLRVRASDPKDFANDFSVSDLLAKPGYEPSSDQDQHYRQVPSRHRHSECWAWLHGSAALNISVFNQQNMLFSVVSSEKRPDGGWLRFGGACMFIGEPAALTRIAPGQSVDLGLARYQSVKGGYMEAALAYRAMLDAQGCRFPPDYNPPVHWEQLYDMPEAWTDRAHKYTKAIVEQEAVKGRDYSCEALYLDPGWDTDFATFLWGEHLGPRRQFVQELQSKYGLKLALHCPLASWMSHQYSWGPAGMKTWPAEAARVPPPEENAAGGLSRLRVPAVREGRRNLALLPGAKPNASSVFQKGAMPIHQIAHLNDGWYGNSASWIAEQMPAWAEVDLGGVFEVSSVRFGNDHAEQFQDRAVTNLRVLAATEYRADSASGSWRAVAEYHGAPVQKETALSFPATTARWVRLELLKGGQDMPRLDEIEVYEAKPVSEAEAAAFAKEARRGPEPKIARGLSGPQYCLGAKQYLAEAEKRLLANCADGAVFLMFDGNWWNGGCLNPQHGHPVPYRIEDHTRANLDLAQRIHAKYPKVLIEMHDTIAGGSPARLTPLYYKYGLPGSYDENWGFELMWDPLADLKEKRARSLYYYNLGCNIPLYLHVNLNKDNESCVVLWWYASTVRHLGIGGTSPNPAVVEAHKQAMRRYRQLAAFYKRGEFYGLGEEIHLHVLPEENGFVVNVFNLSDQPRVVAGEISLARLGLDPKRLYTSADGLGAVRDGRYHLSLELPPWAARVAHFESRGTGPGGVP